MNPQFRLLLVEDNLGLREVLTEHLGKKGYHVTSATDGQEGLNIALKQHPDLVILDIMLPTMDGVTCLHKIRQADNWGKQVPVIILTNVSVNDRRVDEVITELPAFYLVKTDLSMDNLAEKIQDCLVKE